MHRKIARWLATLPVLYCADWMRIRHDIGKLKWRGPSLLIANA